MAGVAGPITAATSSRPPLRRSGSSPRAAQPLGSSSAASRPGSTLISLYRQGRCQCSWAWQDSIQQVSWCWCWPEARQHALADGNRRIGQACALRRSNTGLSRSGTGLTRSTTAATRAGGRTSPSNVTRGKSSSKSPTSTKNRTRTNDRAVRAAGRSSQGCAGAKKPSTSSASSGGTRGCSEPSARRPFQPPRL